GDAAGMVNPFNGEGIAYALETGMLAAGVVADALQNGRNTELVAYREALHDTYGAYYRIGRKFTKIIGRPKIFRALCLVGMRSQTVMEFVFQVLANLGEAQGGGLTDKTLRAMCRLAEQDLSELKEPEISAPTPAVSRKAGAA
ncbi:MAG TPA: hypothetical protein VI541_05885, partial [Actinomycetota bacterium]|nr:hypothetical protein [Actinomycetota bacterium]